MAEADINQIANNVLRYDVDPPSVDYSAYDYGLAVSRSLCPDDAARLVTECLKTLPSSLASSFVDGIFDGVAVPNLETVLLGALLKTREVSSAGPIVDWLVTRCTSNQQSLALRILTAIPRAGDEHAQNTLTYSLWMLPVTKNRGAESPNCGAEAMVRTIIEEIDRILSSDALTPYSRANLASCRKKWGN